MPVSIRLGVAYRRPWRANIAWIFAIMGVLILVPLLIGGPRPEWGEHYSRVGTPILFYSGLAIGAGLVCWAAYLFVYPA